MTALLLLLLLFVVVLILSNAKKAESLEIYHKNNNASFVAEVEEFAKWGERIFKEYCEIVGVSNALQEIKTELEFYNNDSGFMMPKINVKRRSCLGRNFREAFDNFENDYAIHLLRERYSLPSSASISLDPAMRKSLCVWGANSICDPYYTSLFQIIYLNVYLSLCARQFNIGKSGITISEIEEHQQIKKVIEPYKWLSGKFKRY